MRKTLLLIYLMAMTFIAKAVDFEYDGVTYTILSEANKTVSTKAGPAYDNPGHPGLTGELKLHDKVTYNGTTYTLTEIGVYSFSKCSGLTGSLTIPNSVTTLGRGAFYDCRGFTGSLTIGNSVTTIGRGAFEDCWGFTGSLTIGNSVRTIEEFAFSNCNGFTGSLTIPNSVTTIGVYAFQGCRGFNGSLTIGNSVTTIDDDAFSGCSGLTGSLTIPNSVTMIGERAFQSCGSFTSLNIPASVRDIKDRAFYYCSGLKEINVGAKTPPTIYSNTFSNYSATLTVPYGSEYLYANAAYWKNFKDINATHGIYLGVLGFNKEISEKPIALLDESSVNTYTAWVNNLTLDRNTILYYTVDQAIDKLKNHNFGVKLANAVIITFTDGLDQGSLALKAGMSTSRDYANYLSNKIATTKIQDIGLKAYTIGVQGNDVVDDDLFMTNLKSLSSKPENVHHITNINQIEEKFDAIYQDLEMQKNQLILRLTVPMMENGATYRFTLDGVTSAEASKVYVQGTYNSSTKRLEKLQYTGFTSVSGTSVAAVQNGIDLTFTFEDCRDMNGEILSLPSKNAIAEWTYIPSNGKWQPNSEMSDTDIDLEKRNATAIMLLIDCSSSLGSSDFSKLKYTANTFIERLIDYEGKYNGVEDVMVDDCDDSDIDWTDAEYYNMQGVRVMNPTTGFYIRRVGKHVQKVLLR